MAMELGLRERKKLRTRRIVSNAAAALFLEKGFDATTVEEICERAEVSMSTFFRYFGSKEASVFPDEEARIAIVDRILDDRRPDEPWHRLIRRAALELVEYDLASGKDFEGRMGLIEAEPAIAAYALRMQAANIERFTRMLADRLAVDPRHDMRPRLIVSAAFAAVNAAWTAWVASGMKGDLRALVGAAFDVVDRGLASALPD